MDYTTLSLAEVRSALQAVARDAETTFGGLDAGQLKWRPDGGGWSVGQCFQHLLTANGLMFRAAEDALRGGPRTLWQRMPVLPGLLGRVLIRSQAPSSARKFTAPTKAQPPAVAIPGDIIQRFVDQHRETAERLRTLDELDAARAIMVSPFIKVVAYSVLDGYRLVVAHDRRHFEQAHRVMLSGGFPQP